MIACVDFYKYLHTCIFKNMHFRSCVEYTFNLESRMISNISFPWRIYTLNKLIFPPMHRSKKKYFLPLRHRTHCDHNTAKDKMFYTRYPLPGHVHSNGAV